MGEGQRIFFLVEGGGGLKILKEIRGMVKISESGKGGSQFF